MEKVIKILMERDHLTREEARNVVKNVLDILYVNADDYEYCEEIWMEETGLEVDYLLEVLT